MTILPREQSNSLDQRLRELCFAGMPGTKIVNTVNSERGLNWTLQGYFSRVKRLGLPWTATAKAGRPIGGAEYLPEDQRQLCYQDPAYEARNRISNRIVCRECYQLLNDGSMQARAGKAGHLWAIHHGMTLKQYRVRNPGAPAFTCERIAGQEDCTVEKVMARQAGEYVTPDELAASLKDRCYEDRNGLGYVICRVERCGFKSIKSLTKHLRNAHGISSSAYRKDGYWPLMPKPVRDKIARQHRDEIRELKKAEQRATVLREQLEAAEETVKRLQLEVEGEPAKIRFRFKNEVLPKFERLFSVLDRDEILSDGDHKGFSRQEIFAARRAIHARVPAAKLRATAGRYWLSGDTNRSDETIRKYLQQ